MKKEFKFFVRQKYLLIITILFAFCLVAAISMALDNTENVTTDFCYEIEKYNNIEEIIERFEKIQKPDDQDYIIKTEPRTENEIKYYTQLYNHIIDNNLPYDSLVEFEDASYGAFRKHTSFHLFGLSAYMIMMLIVFCGCLIGSIYPTIDFTKKTAKLVYTSGDSKIKILFRKYLVSLSALLSLELLLEIVMSVVSLAYINSGASECYILIEDKLYFLNYIQFVLLHIAHNIMMCVVFYTIIFFFSFLCKSTIVSTISVFSLLLLNTMITIRFKQIWMEIVYNMPTSGLFGCLISENYCTNAKYMLLMLVYVFIAIVLCATSLFALKKYDYSR